MTPSATAKSYGLASLAQLAATTGETKRNLIRWHKERPQRFHMLCVGAAYELYGMVRRSKL